MPRSRRLLLLSGAMVAAIGLLASACGGDDDDEPAATAPTTGSPGAGPSGGTPGGTSPAPALPAEVEALTRSPRYVTVEVNRGDTLASIADAFDTAPGAAPNLTAGMLRALNQLPNDTIVAGRLIVVPLLLAGDRSFIPDASIGAAIGAGGAGGKLLLLEPGTSLREGLLNRIALQKVRIADGTPGGEGFGYIMEYGATDRPVTKGGGVDPDARFTGTAFAVAAGSLAASLQSARTGDLHTFTRDGVTYAVKVYPAIQRTPAEIAAGLGTAAER